MILELLDTFVRCQCHQCFTCTILLRKSFGSFFLVTFQLWQKYKSAFIQKTLEYNVDEIDGRRQPWRAGGTSTWTTGSGGSYGSSSSPAPAVSLSTTSSSAPTDILDPPQCLNSFQHLSHETLFVNKLDYWFFSVQWSNFLEQVSRQIILTFD